MTQIFHSWIFLFAAAGVHSFASGLLGNLHLFYIDTSTVIYRRTVNPLFLFVKSGNTIEYWWNICNCTALPA